MRGYKVGEYLQRNSCPNYHIPFGWLVNIYICPECGEKLAPCVARIEPGKRAKHWWQDDEIKFKFVRWLED